MDFFLCVIGMVMIVEGLPYFIFPLKMKTWVLMVAEMPEGSLRRVGLALMILGLGLVYMGKRRLKADRCILCLITITFFHRRVSHSNRWPLGTNRGSW